MSAAIANQCDLAYSLLDAGSKDLTAHLFGFSIPQRYFSKHVEKLYRATVGGSPVAPFGRVLIRLDSAPISADVFPLHVQRDLHDLRRFIHFLGARCSAPSVSRV